MKINEQWLRTWVNPSETIQALAQQLTMAGLEVDNLSPVAGAFEGVVVAKVMKAEPHPEADRLQLCQVDAGEGELLPIVCGAANVRTGLKVALAKIGAVLPGDFKIKKAKLRGEVSMGMICSSSELGMSEQSEGIMELAEDAPIGMNFREYLNLDDYVLDIDLTPNRADCFSVRGISRELAALNQLPFSDLEVPAIPPQSDRALTVSLNYPEGCPHYCGRVIQGINPQAKTPVWLAERLRRCGIRPLHPVVDVTNYVMLELGQPMHAFDLTKMEGGIQVRQSHADECIDLLDGQTVKLKAGQMLIADEKKALAIAGVMGGADSAVQEDTTAIFLESAYFNPLTVAGVARQYGLSSDSSQRYERGVDPALQLKAMERATALILEIAGGEACIISEASDEKYQPKEKTLAFNTEKFQRLTGVRLDFERIQSSLESLGMRVLEEKAPVIQVAIPSYRFDLQIEEDLVEEILRLYGYDKLAAAAVDVAMQAGTYSANEALTIQVADWFSHRGYQQTITYSFVDPKLQENIYPEQASIPLLNPISTELSEMRRGLWPGLIASMVHNVHRQQTAMKLFEIAGVFHRHEEKIEERAMLAGLMTGERASLDWSEQSRDYDFFDMKGDLEALFSEVDLKNIRFEAASHPALHPGKTAEIKMADRCIGSIGVMHPELAEALDIPQEVILFELELAALEQTSRPLYRPVSRYPMIRRDLSFLIDEDVPAADIKSVIHQAVTQDWLRSLEVFDLYQGKGIPNGKKSIGIALILQDRERTLVDEEINALISAIIKSLEDKFAITLRE